MGPPRLALEQAGLALPEVDAIAVTAAPGLIGAVLVGVNFAKGLALAAGKPLVPEVILPRRVGGGQGISLRVAAPADTVQGHPAGVGQAHAPGGLVKVLYYD